jgi:hypothetical protein
MGTILVILLAVLILASVPKWSYNREWGYGLSGFLGLTLAIVLVLVCCTDKLSWSF